MVYFRPNLTQIMEPLLHDDWQKSNVELPFESFNRHAYPEVQAILVSLFIPKFQFPPR